MTDQPEAKEPAIVELTPAPEILVDGYVSSIAPNGVVRLTFFSLAHSLDSRQLERRVVLRLAASFPAIDGIQRSLAHLIEEAKRASMEG